MKSIKRFFGLFNIVRALKCESESLEFLKFIVGIGIILMIIVSFPLVTDFTIISIKVFLTITGWTMLFTVMLNKEQDKFDNVRQRVEDRRR